MRRRAIRREARPACPRRPVPRPRCGTRRNGAPRGSRRHAARPSPTRPRPLRPPTAGCSGLPEHRGVRPARSAPCVAGRWGSAGHRPAEIARPSSAEAARPPPAGVALRGQLPEFHREGHHPGGPLPGEPVDEGREIGYSPEPAPAATVSASSASPGTTPPSAGPPRRPERPAPGPAVTHFPQQPLGALPVHWFTTPGELPHGERTTQPYAHRTTRAGIVVQQPGQLLKFGNRCLVRPRQHHSCPHGRDPPLDPLRHVRHPDAKPLDATAPFIAHRPPASPPEPLRPLASTPLCRSTGRTATRSRGRTAQRPARAQIGPHLAPHLTQPAPQRVDALLHSGRRVPHPWARSSRRRTMPYTKPSSRLRSPASSSRHEGNSVVRTAGGLLAAVVAGLSGAEGMPELSQMIGASRNAVVNALTPWREQDWVRPRAPSVRPEFLSGLPLRQPRRMNP